MLDEIAPEQFDEWLAYDQLRLDPIVETLKLGFAALCRAWELKLSPEDFTPNLMAPEADTTTNEPVASPETTVAVSPNQAVAMLAAYVGGAR